MNAVIVTNTPEFSNDLADVVRLMLPGTVVVSERADPVPCLTHTHTQDGNYWHEHCVWEDAQGQRMEQAWSVPIAKGEIVEKRMRKRALKQCCYYLLKRYTGQVLPWGSLTGIRPTRLYYEALSEGHAGDAAISWLMRVFDLLPDKAALLEDIVREQAPFIHVEPNEVDIYIAIPFCVTRCAYCSFASEVLGQPAAVEAYLAALHKEIKAVHALIHDAGLKPRALYIGGGTPTALTALQLDALLALLHKCFDGVQEWTVEAGRPDTMDDARLAAIRRYPVTRISINPQTMNDATLHQIGRAHSAQDVMRAYKRARAMGFDNINMDLIAALPGESVSDFLHTLDAISALSPDSLTIHTLARKRASKLHDDDQFKQTDGLIAGEMLTHGARYANAMHMMPYYLYRQKQMAGNLENVGYARAGAVCRYNIDIMEETTSILALGAGAITKRIYRDKGRIERAPNMMETGHYIARLDEMIARKRKLWAQ